MTFGDGFSSILSMILISTGIIAAFLIFYVIRKHRRQGNIDSNDFMQRYVTLLEGTNPASGVIESYWNGFLLMRWIATVFIMVVVRNSYSLQILMLLGMSWVFTLFLVVGKPKREDKDNKIAVFNELLISVYLYLMICLSGFS